MLGTLGGRALLNEPLCPSWLRLEHGVQGSWAQIKTRFISLSVDRGGFEGSGGNRVSCVQG